MLQRIKQYLNEILDLNIEISPLNEQGKLPFFLTDKYSFYETSLLKTFCILMIGAENKNITPITLRKHQEIIQKKWKEALIIYVQSSINFYNRKCLIKYHIPFLIPGNQLYLPDSGLDLREHFQNIYKKENWFSPSTQTVVIYALLQKTREKLTGSILSEKLGYTSMTMCRAFTELKACEIGEFRREGKENFWIFKDKTTLWIQAKLYFRNPVKKRIWVKNNTLKISAGLSALSHFSKLSAPALPVFAIGANKLTSYQLNEVLDPLEADAEIEIWHYDPGLFAKHGIVDPISLYCSLVENKDERIQISLEEMMEKVW